MHRSSAHKMSKVILRITCVRQERECGARRPTRDFPPVVSLPWTIHVGRLRCAMPRTARRDSAARRGSIQVFLNIHFLIIYLSFHLTRHTADIRPSKNDAPAEVGPVDKQAINISFVTGTLVLSGKRTPMSNGT